MIDIENKIVDTISNAVGDVYVSSTFQPVPEEVPCVMVSYYYDGDLSRTFTVQKDPHHARVSVQIDVIANDKKTAKSLNATCVDTMHQLMFTCTDSQDIGGFYEGLVRYVSRYTAIVQETESDGVMTTCRIYRR